MLITLPDGTMVGGSRHQLRTAGYLDSSGTPRVPENALSLTPPRLRDSRPAAPIEAPDVMSCVARLRATDPALTEEAAQLKAFEADPALYDRYRLRFAV